MVFPSRCHLIAFPIKIKILGYVGFLIPSLSRIFVHIRERWLTFFTFHKMVKIQISSGHNNRRTNLEQSICALGLESHITFLQMLDNSLHHPLPSDILTKRGL